MLKEVQVPGAVIQAIEAKEWKPVEVQFLVTQFVFNYYRILSQATTRRILIYIIYEGRLQSSWTHLITPSRNFVEVR
jgi:hypothetical protein